MPHHTVGTSSNQIMVTTYTYMLMTGARMSCRRSAQVFWQLKLAIAFPDWEALMLVPQLCAAPEQPVHSPIAGEEEYCCILATGL